MSSKNESPINTQEAAYTCEEDRYFGVSKDLLITIKGLRNKCREAAKGMDVSTLIQILLKWAHQTDVKCKSHTDMSPVARRLFLVDPDSLDFAFCHVEGAALDPDDFLLTNSRRVAMFQDLLNLLHESKK